MISAERFSNITNEVITLINNALFELLQNYPEEYVLFLASGEYDEAIAKNKSLNLMPYTISGHSLDAYYDLTRQTFLCEFLNKHYVFSDSKELQDDEYRINIEFLIYTHIWEAKIFLKKIHRLADLLCGKEYNWNAQIFNKPNFIRDKIVESFNSANCLLGQVISDNYKTNLRNAIAHSDYHIDMDSKQIAYDLNKRSRTISFDEWSIHFAYSVCLSYHFSDIVSKRRKNIIQDWGKNYFTIKMPFSDSTTRHVCIQYLEDEDDFDFIRK